MRLNNNFFYTMEQIKIDKVVFYGSSKKLIIFIITTLIMSTSTCVLQSQYTMGTDLKIEVNYAKL